MARIDKQGAQALASHHGFTLSGDFHALTPDQVEGVIAAAKAVAYRAPKVRNGSTGRYFYAYLQRQARKES